MLGFMVLLMNKMDEMDRENKIDKSSFCSVLPSPKPKT